MYKINLMRAFLLARTSSAVFWLKLSCLLVFFVGALFSFSHLTKAEGENSILLQPSFQQMGMKEEFQVAVVINTDKPLVGADVRISYDPRVVEVQSIDEGDTFRNLPLKSAADGTISITGVAEKGQEFTGTGVLATLNLRGVDAGDTNLIIAFEPDSTSDSNLTQLPANDVLSKVEVGHYLIGSPTQRTTGAIKRFILKVIPYVIFLAFLAIVGYLAYRWYKNQKEQGGEVFVPEEIPLDQPPEDKPAEQAESP